MTATKADPLPSAEAETCGCGIYVHPSRRNPAAIHIPDCKYAGKPSAEPLSPCPKDFMPLATIRAVAR